MDSLLSSVWYYVFTSTACGFVHRASNHYHVDRFIHYFAYIIEQSQLVYRTHGRIILYSYRRIFRVRNAYKRPWIFNHNQCNMISNFTNNNYTFIHESVENSATLTSNIGTFASNWLTQLLCHDIFAKLHLRMQRQRFPTIRIVTWEIGVSFPMNYLSANVMEQANWMCINVLSRFWLAIKLIGIIRWFQ